MRMGGSDRAAMIWWPRASEKRDRRVARQAWLLIPRPIPASDPTYTMGQMWQTRLLIYVTPDKAGLSGVMGPGLSRAPKTPPSVVSIPAANPAPPCSPLHRELCAHVKHRARCRTCQRSSPVPPAFLSVRVPEATRDPSRRLAAARGETLQGLIGGLAVRVL